MEPVSKDTAATPVASAAPADPASADPRFEVVKWNAVALWSWGKFCDCCSRNSRCRSLACLLKPLQILLWTIAPSAETTSWIYVSLLPLPSSCSQSPCNFLFVYCYIKGFLTLLSSSIQALNAKQTGNQVGLQCWHLLSNNHQRLHLSAGFVGWHCYVTVTECSLIVNVLLFFAIAATAEECNVAWGVW